MLKKTLISLKLMLLPVMLQSHSAYAASTEEVWARHIEAWEARSVEAIVSDYSEQSVLVLNNKIFKGQAQIAHVFRELFKIFDYGVNRIDSPILFDRFVYITWHFTPHDAAEFFGSDTFVIEDGKIVLQTIASKLYEDRPIRPFAE